MTNFDDLSAIPGVSYTYMVRAVKLETSASGTYLNSSQGVFMSAAPGAVSGPEISLSGNDEPIPSGASLAMQANRLLTCSPFRMMGWGNSIILLPQTMISWIRRVFLGQVINGLI